MDSTKIKSIPYLGGGLATTATTGTKSIDGGRDQRQEAAGNEEMIRRPPMAERAIARAKGFRETSKILARGYI